MDAGILREAGTDPANFRRAYVADHGLRIGRRAALVASPGGRVYGMLVALTHADIGRLYAAPGLESYRPEAVVVCLLDGGSAPALCYNLVEAPGVEERNPEYAQRLRGVLAELGFPAAYLESVG